MGIDSDIINSPTLRILSCLIDNNLTVDVKTSQKIKINLKGKVYIPPPTIRFLDLNHYALEYPANM